LYSVAKERISEGSRFLEVVGAVMVMMAVGSLNSFLADHSRRRLPSMMMGQVLMKTVARTMQDYSLSRRVAVLQKILEEEVVVVMSV